MRQTIFSLLCCLFAVLVVTPLAATAQQAQEQNPCALPSYRTDVRPDPTGEPTEVLIGMRLVDLLAINDVDQTISLDLSIRMQWTDSRLAAWEGCKLPIGSIWFPKLALKNSGRIFERWPDMVSVGEGGRIIYLQRSSGTFSSYHKLGEFPFDTQNISLHFFPLDWSAEKLVFMNDTAFTGASEVLNISDWQFLGIKAALREANFEFLDQVRAGYDLTITAKRHLSFYMWKIFLPITMIVMMSWSVFWIDPAQYGTQIGLSATTVLTMVAFIFATTSMLPSLGYFTMLDRYIALATLFVFLALLQSLTTSFLVSRKHVEQAKTLDIVSRFAFPIGFVAICWLVYSKAI
ncbi:hypothetical protein QO034_14915 [Sedimentitalea sp. JM2-8]|uniref:Neurotransmitter-gated ion-channel ligand binding domain-containing protein n=1 Tax=Sedimentitalea xiamensis TaxID=3050037 RepID=A0ABT7FHD0_9RHOB|nr:hypothetical protein [Sedimentitalea xiamensis]MDK3074390.1 hypothetical protein [Sedimentitalea xiamensis]